MHVISGATVALIFLSNVVGTGSDSQHLGGVDFINFVMSLYGIVVNLWNHLSVSKSCSTYI